MPTRQPRHGAFTAHSFGRALVNVNNPFGKDCQIVLKRTRAASQIDVIRRPSNSVRSFLYGVNAQLMADIDVTVERAHFMCDFSNDRRITLFLAHSWNCALAVDRIAAAWP
jgi:hypothetical protein